MKATCPNNTEHKLFVTKIWVEEDYVVDESGNLTNTHIEDGEKVVREPLISNPWICAACGAKAKVILT